MKSDRPSPDSSNPLFFKSQRPSEDKPACIDIFCYKHMSKSDTSAIGKTLKNAGIKYRIWQSEKDFGVSLIKWHCEHLTPNNMEPLAVLFLQPIYSYECHLPWDFKHISCDGKLADALYYGSVTSSYDMLHHRIKAATEGRDRRCELEFVSYYPDHDMFHTVRTEDYDDEEAGLKKFKATFHRIGGKGWDTLAKICKAKLASEPVSQPSAGLTQ